MTAPVSISTRLRPSLAGALVTAAALMLSACGATTPGGQVPTGPSRPVVGDPPEPATAAADMAQRVYTPAHMAGRERELVRIGLLLPFGARSAGARAEASQLLRAAELALFEQGEATMLLLPKDTGGTAEGGREAAESAIADGADLIIGPLFSAAAETVGEIARAARVPVIAFSTDAAVAGNGLYLLSFPPEEEVRRVTEYALEQGATRFAAITPDSAYGQLARDTYAATIGAGLVGSETYSGGVESMTQAARRLARLGVERLDPRQAAGMSGADWRPSPGSPFQVVLMPEGGDRLRMLAPVLLYEDIDPLLVKFIGTGLWRDSSLAREPALAYGWFASAEPEARGRFERAYQSVYRDSPSRLAGLAYDAVALAALMAREPGRGDAQRFIEQPGGFSGVDGLFRFRPDGTIQRALAVYTIQGGRFQVISPAPEQFDGAPRPRRMDRTGPS